MPPETETKEKEIIVAIKIKESEYSRLTRLISGEIILHATAKKSNVKAVVNSIDIRAQVVALRDEVQHEHGKDNMQIASLRGNQDAYGKVLKILDGDGS